jgi:hypothetical protein
MSIGIAYNPCKNCKEMDKCSICELTYYRKGYIKSPIADAVEVRSDYNVGDFCLYGFADGNKSLAIVEIIKILDDKRKIAGVKFHKVIIDNTGNGFFHYLFKSGKTMNASFKYLKNITPEIVEDEKG